MKKLISVLSIVCVSSLAANAQTATDTTKAKTPKDTIKTKRVELGILSTSPATLAAIPGDSTKKAIPADTTKPTPSAPKYRDYGFLGTNRTLAMVQPDPTSDSTKTKKPDSTVVKPAKPQVN